MSLINKMLQDLEARETVSAGATTPVYQDLRPVEAPRERGPWGLLTVLVVVLGFGAAAYFAAGRMGITLFSPTVVATKPSKAPVPLVVAKSKSASTSTPAKRPPVPVPPAREHPNAATPAVVDPKPAVIEPAAPAQISAEQKPAVVAPPPQRAPASTNSHNKAHVSIVREKQPIPASMHKGGAREPAAVKVPTPSRPTAIARNAEHVVVDKKVRPFTAQEQAELDYRRAVRFLDQGRPDDARASLRKALVAQPAHVKARELAAGLALQSGHWREAQSLLEGGLRLVPSHYPFARLLARVYLDHGAETKALAVMESAEPQGADDPDFCSLLGLLYQRAGRHAEAAKIYNRSLQLRPDDARSWLGFAISLESTEQWDAAKKAYSRAHEIGGLSPRLMQYAAQRLAALTDR